MEALSVLLHVSKIGAIMVITAMLLALGKNKTVSIFFQQMIIKKTCNLIKTSAVGLNSYIYNTYIHKKRCYVFLVFEVKLPYDPVCLSVKVVGYGWSVCHYF